LSRPLRLRLLPGQWVPLPGTGFEILLHGRKTPSSDGVDIDRDQPRTSPFGGWNLTPVLGRTYARRVR
jgi:hypothetical protein